MLDVCYLTGFTLTIKEKVKKKIMKNDIIRIYINKISNF